MKLVNLTPHEVVFFRQSDCVRLPVGLSLRPTPTLCSGFRARDWHVPMPLSVS